MEDIQPVIDRQIKLNSAIAQEGLDNNYGAQIGKTLMHVWGKSVTTRACARRLPEATHVWVAAPCRL